jgi:DNA-binding cell septation regulator SpoVG
MTSGSWGKVRAFFDVKVGGFTMKGFKLVEGKDGLFVGNPNYKGSDGEYHDFCFVEKEDRQKMLELAQKKNNGSDDSYSPEPVKSQENDEDIPF